MKSHPVRAALLAATLAVAAACAQASDVTVTPENMGDWSIATNRGAIAELAAYGPAVFERQSAWIADDSARTNLGTGAFYAQLDDRGCDTNWDTPPTAWLGLDGFNNQPLAGKTLSQITKMQYYGYVSHVPTNGKSSWDSWQWWKYPRQPISLQITAEHPVTGVRKQFSFLPWTTVAEPCIRGENSGTYSKLWIKYDCINGLNTDPRGTWIDSHSPWYAPSDDMVGTGEMSGSWAVLLAAKPDPGAATTYGDYKLVATSTDPYPTGWKSAGWAVDDGLLPGGGCPSVQHTHATIPPGSPTCTATGKCINFEYGARQCRPEWIFWAEQPPDHGGGIQLYNDYTLGKGYVDKFTLGISGTEVTYDFEPSSSATPPKVAATNNRAAYDSVIHVPSAQKHYLTKISGKAVSVLNQQVKFQLDDGSGSIVQCWLFSGGGPYTFSHTVQVGDYTSVWGYLERPPFVAQNGGPMLIWTVASHIEDPPYWW